MLGTQIFFGEFYEFNCSIILCNKRKPNELNLRKWWNFVWPKLGHQIFFSWFLFQLNASYHRNNVKENLWSKLKKIAKKLILDLI